MRKLLAAPLFLYLQRRARLGERRQGLSKTAPMACLPKPGREPWPPDAPWQTHRRYLARCSCLTNVFSASLVQLVSGAGDENERLAAERGKLGGAGSVRDPCGFGPDKARRHVSGSSWHARYHSARPPNWGILLRPARTRLSRDDGQPRSATIRLGLEDPPQVVPIDFRHQSPRRASKASRSRSGSRLRISSPPMAV